MIITFERYGPDMVNKMHDLMVGILDNLWITYSPYIELILKWADMKKFRSVLVSCNDNLSEEMGREWNLGELKDFKWKIFGHYPSQKGFICTYML